MSANNRRLSTSDWISVVGLVIGTILSLIGIWIAQSSENLTKELSKQSQTIKGFDSLLSQVNVEIAILDSQYKRTLIYEQEQIFQGVQTLYISASNFEGQVDFLEKNINSDNIPLITACIRSMKRILDREMENKYLKANWRLNLDWHMTHETVCISLEKIEISDVDWPFLKKALKKSIPNFKKLVSDASRNPYHTD